ncbi:D-lactate dehydrogenase [Altererythrobacter sp. GH1-8]|uniref:D-lactate dehydrogenase n=1 Tax=Altererythrobacter sp. GH1-8 TaxID=3349333 RepID=UPI00374DB908
MLFRLPGKVPTLADQSVRLLAELRSIVGSQHVIADPSTARSYLHGYRIGGGDVLAVVRPNSLLELWRATQAIIRAGAIIITQAANTGLTGGSTPSGSYDRPVVLISTRRIKGIIAVNGGSEALCLAGSTLTELEHAIAPFGRLPHSVIGSSCIGASVVGGICNNSGGALVHRGPAFTRQALYAQVKGDGSLRLVNHLDVDLGDEAEAMLMQLDQKNIADELVLDQTDTPHHSPKVTDYKAYVRDSKATPARYNADPRCLFEASGCAGKLIVFAVRVPTYPAPRTERSFLVGSNETLKLSRLRQSILAETKTLPSVCEYMNRSASKLAATHGRDICHMLRIFGPAAMPRILAAQTRFDSLWGRTGASSSASARVSQAFFSITPHPLPERVRKLFADHEHCLLITAIDDGIEELEHILDRASADDGLTSRTLDQGEAAAAFRLRFASAGATVRVRDLAKDSGALVALDIALPRNTEDWHTQLPEHLESQVLAKAEYGHFLCHVFHLDYVLKPGIDPQAFEDEVKTLIEAAGGQMPAEHNFGHLYRAPQAVVDFYRELDPTNSCNPGIGKTTKARNWQDEDRA